MAAGRRRRQKTTDGSQQGAVQVIQQSEQQLNPEVQQTTDMAAQKLLPHAHANPEQHSNHVNQVDDDILQPQTAHGQEQEVGDTDMEGDDAEGIQRSDEPGSGLLDTEDVDIDSSREGTPDGKPKKRKRKVLSEEKLKRLKEDYDRRGVVYISRIPPHMKPMKLKQLLDQYGTTLRVYCAPEDPNARKLRKQKGGNTGKNFTEGWVEFKDKRIAKRVAIMLNGQRIGGKRRSAYYDDLWCIKYLKHFKWDHLTEDIAYQKAVREQRLATEISAAKRERDHYLAQVDRLKGLTAMAERRASKQQGDQETQVAGAKPSENGEATATTSQRINKGLSLRNPKPDPSKGVATGNEVSDDVLMMLARKKKPKLHVD